MFVCLYPVFVCVCMFAVGGGVWGIEILEKRVCYGCYVCIYFKYNIFCVYRFPVYAAYIYICRERERGIHDSLHECVCVCIEREMRMDSIASGGMSNYTCMKNTLGEYDSVDYPLSVPLYLYVCV